MFVSSVFLKKAKNHTFLKRLTVKNWPCFIECLVRLLLKIFYMTDPLIIICKSSL